jgi:hypothetical protein
VPLQVFKVATSKDLQALSKDLQAQQETFSKDLQAQSKDLQALKETFSKDLQALSKDLSKDLLAQSKDQKFYLVVALVAIPVLSTGLPALLPFVVKMLP